MGYLEKEKNLIQAMIDKGFPPKGNKEACMKMMEHALKSFPEYHNTVVTQQALIPIYQATKEGADFREAVQNLDRTRKLNHDCAISGMNMLNRMSKFCDVEPFFTVDTEDRHAVAEEIGKYCNEVYDHGIQNQPEKEQEGRRRQYDDAEVANHMKELRDEMELG